MNVANISFDLSTKKFIAQFGDKVIAKGNFRAYVAAVIELGLSKKAKKLDVTKVNHIDEDKDPVVKVKRAVKAAVKAAVLFTVIRKKDNVVVAENLTKADAEAMIEKAKSAKKAALTLA